LNVTGASIRLMSTGIARMTPPPGILARSERAFGKYEKFDRLTGETDDFGRTNRLDWRDKK
jgi:hypothetical protein